MGDLIRWNPIQNGQISLGPSVTIVGEIIIMKQNIAILFENWTSKFLFRIK